MTTTLTKRYNDALIFAVNLHDGQYRKGTSIPYAAHLLAVSALVLEYGGDENQAMAALLHDAVEDQGGAQTLLEIASRFGEDVSGIVADCSDSWETPKPPWRKRKESYLEHLKAVPDRSKLVSCADKIHNGRAIARDTGLYGEGVWTRFKGGKDGTIWYYSALLQVFQGTFMHPIVSELDEVVKELRIKAGADMH